MKTRRACMTLALGCALSACTSAEIPTRNIGIDAQFGRVSDRPGGAEAELDLMALGLDPQSIQQAIGVNVLGPDPASPL